MFGAISRSFNLIDEPWIPCVTRDHVRREFSLRELIHEADTISGLDSPSPQVTAGLYRLLLAFLHRALEGPRTRLDWAALFNQRNFPVQQIEAYIERWHERFDLFHPRYPFFQCANFQLATPRPAIHLAQEQSDNSAMDSAPLLSFAAAARYLVANQAFALGGGAGTSSARYGKHPNFTHAPLVGRTVVFLRGRTLFESLLLNLLVAPGEALSAGIPAWEREHNVRSPGVHGDVRYLELLTWQSRCIRLIAEQHGVRSMYYAQGEIIDPEQRLNDPLTLRYVYAGKIHAIRQIRARAPWRDCGHLFARRTGHDERPEALKQFSDLCRAGLFPIVPPLQCMLLGMANERAKVVAQTRQLLPLPQRLIDDSEALLGVHFALELCESTASALDHASQLLVGIGRPQVTGEVEQFYWQALEDSFYELLESLGAQSAQLAVSHWAQAVRRAALNAYALASSALAEAPEPEIPARAAAEQYLTGALVSLGLAS